MHYVYVLLGSRLDELSEELLTIAIGEHNRQITLTSTGYHPDYDIFRTDSEVRSRVYEIGVEANSIGGFDAMQALLYKTFRPAGGDHYNFTEPAEMSKSAINGADKIWDGIGTWMA